MKRSIRPTLYLFLLLGCGTAMRSQELLTNDTVIKMTEARVNERDILEAIRESPGKFTLTASALITLKQHGVSDNVITAMKAKVAPKPDTSQPAPSRTAPPTPQTSTAAESRWHVRNFKDEITGEAKFEATLTQPARSNGQFQVTASCGDDAVLFKVAYISAAGLGYQLTNLKPSPKVVARVAIDGRVTSAVSSVPEHPNEAQFLFSHKQGDGMQFWAALLKGASGISVTDIAPDELYAAKEIKMEMPLGNGDLPILQIHPQEPEFQSFAAKCETTDTTALARKAKEEKEKKEADAKQAAAAAELLRQQQLADVVKQRADEFKAVSANMMADEFDSRLQEAVKARGEKLSVDPSQFASSMKTVGDIVRLCSSISEADYAASLNSYGIPNLLNFKGGKYKDCIPAGRARRIPESTDQPALLIRHDLRQHWDVQQKRWDATKFHIDVFLRPTVVVPYASQIEFEARYIALSADITNGGITAAPRYVCSGARITTLARSTVIVRVPTKVITRPDPGIRGMVSIELEGDNEWYTAPLEQIKDSCR